MANLASAGRTDAPHRPWAGRLTVAVVCLLGQLVGTSPCVSAAVAGRADTAQQEDASTPRRSEPTTPPRVTEQRERTEAEIARRASRYAQWTVTSLQVSGMPAELAGGIAKKLALGVRSGFLRLRKPRLNPADLTADRRRLELYLARNGYPLATTAVRFEPNTAKQTVVVAIDVTPGPPVRFGEIRTTGMPADLARATKRALAPLRPEAPFSDAAVAAVREDLEIELLRSGFAQADVTVSVAMAAGNRTGDDSPAAKRADVTFGVAAGDRFTVTSVSVTGAPADLQRLTERSAYVTPGTPYSPLVIKQARENLRSLDLFRQIRLDMQQTEPTSLALHAEVTPRKYRSIEASIGSWRDNPIVISALWTHRNLFKQGRGLFVGGLYGKHDQRFETRVWWSALIRVRSRAELGYVYKVEDEPSYWLRSNEIQLSNLFHSLGTVSWRVGIAYSDNDLDQRTMDEEAFLQQDGRQLIATGRWYRETVDIPLDPRSGSRLTLNASIAPQNKLTDSPFAALDGSWAPVWSLGTSPRLAARLNVGYSWPLGDAVDVLPNRRFFAGGYNTHRGYTRRRLGPYDSAGNPIGGELMALASAEARFAIKGRVGGDFFVDTGQIWRKADEFDFAQIAVAVGGGVALATPIGPIRLDVGYNLTAPPPGNSRTVYHLGIGHPY